MRTAILFSGTSYNFKHSIPSLMENLVVPNNADVFILTSRYNMRRRTTAGELAPVEDWGRWIIKSKGIERYDTTVTDADVDYIKSVFGNHLKGIWFIDDMPDYLNYLQIKRDEFKEAINHRRENFNPAPFGSDVTSTDNGNVKCVIDQYNHVKKCFELMAKHEVVNGKYDYVMRVRLDFIVPFKFNISHYYLGQDHPYLYVCGSVRKDEMEWADEFCFWGRRDIAEPVFMAMDKMGFVDKGEYNTIANNNEFLFAPETQFSLLLYKLNIKILNVLIFRSGQWSVGGDGYDYMNYRFRRELNLDHEYSNVLRGPSDINEHLPVLREYAEKCEHVTELGTRYGNSTIAFLVAKPKTFITYDVQHNDKIDYLRLLGADVRLENPQEIEETDLLFIDTDHHVDQCSKELKLHADRVRKYLIFHDVVSFWEKGQGYESGGGLKYAIQPFMSEHPEWKQVYRAENNNGLLILERC